jgi:hypothetical protein
MKTNIKEQSESVEHYSADAKEVSTVEVGLRQMHPDLAGIIDHKVALLSVAGTAARLNAENCLEVIVQELEATGITKSDIRTAVESGRFVGAYPELGAQMFEHTCSTSADEESEYAAVVRKQN